MTIPSNQAEQCLRELAQHAKPWNTPECLEIVKRHMAAALDADRAKENAVLQDEVELKQACISGMRAQADKMAAELDATRQWYAVRFERLKDLVRTLPELVQNEFFSILANGTASAAEPPSYSQQLNALQHERDCLREQVYAYPPAGPFAPDQNARQASTFMPGKDGEHLQDALLRGFKGDE